jgi:Putative beta-barrel porin-2, OmpL-like. bbp2
MINFRLCTTGLLAITLGLAQAAAGAQTPATAPPSPPATTTPLTSPTPAPVITVNGVALALETLTASVNATGNLANGGGADQSTRFNISSAFITIARNTGFFRYGASGGVYSIPVVGLSGNKTFQVGANVNTYGPLPSAYVGINPNDHVSLVVGYLATLIGQEYTYTYQNWSIQRGLVWNMETAVSRGARLTLTGGKFTGALEVNDGFFSGHYLGLEGSLTMAPDSNRAFQFVFVIPNSQAPGNWTASVANKRLYNFMYTATSGHWTFAPYVLLVQSPKSSALGYTNSESAYGVVFLSTYAMNANWSLATRVEDITNRSTTQSSSPNADLVGYGRGSGAWTFTLTPSYRRGQLLVRADLSQVTARAASPGLAFGTLGLQRGQFRFVLESGLQF